MGWIRFALYLSVMSVASGCAALTADDDGSGFVEHAFEGSPEKQKNIFVFLDGTKNTMTSKTNVWRLFQLLRNNNDPQKTAIYISGVGSFDSAPLSGAVLGRGMEARILKGYEFISKNFRENDKVYIFGFSRGAHQARALAGLISYAGILAARGQGSKELTENGNRVIELVKKQIDEDYRRRWQAWRPGQTPFLSSILKKEYDLVTVAAEISFLGVWDTVPGSSLKDYGTCSEEVGFVKKHLHWMIPGIDKGERYKSGSYPPIRRVVHAVSLDEKRSKFWPLLLCDAINPAYTKVTEFWFPGAHADVGGGYEDSNELPGISLKWMLEELSNSYNFDPMPAVEANAQGLAHWSMADYPANAGSICIDRNDPDETKKHPSFTQRKRNSPARILWSGVEKELPYPVKCPKQQ